MIAGGSAARTGCLWSRLLVTLPLESLLPQGQRGRVGRAQVEDSQVEEEAAYIGEGGVNEGRV
jgi:hypothetical protein